MAAAPYAVSVVIPTLGGDCLRETIERLNGGSVVPAEILVCIPREDAGRVKGYVYPNVRILATACRGQVAQRAEGFRHAACDFVLQIDDDIIVDEHCLARMVETQEQNGARCAVAPDLRWLGTRVSVYRKITPPAIAKIFYWLVNGRKGYRPGTVTRAGAEIGLPSGTRAPIVAESEWLPGGCVLHWKANLVTENYFPFAGKAYCEDLIHSHLLKRREIRLIVNQQAIAYLDEAPHGSMVDFLKSLRSDLRARRHYVELSARSKPRMYWYYLAKILRRVVQR